MTKLDSPDTRCPRLTLVGLPSIGPAVASVWASSFSSTSEWRSLGRARQGEPNWITSPPRTMRATPIQVASGMVSAKKYFPISTLTTAKTAT